MNNQKDSIIASALNKYIVASQIREDYVGERKFYVSDMGKCARTRFLKRKGIITRSKPSSWMFFFLGTALHDEGFKGLNSQGVLLSTEQAVEDEHFKGRYDGKVKYIKKPTIFDFKSTSAKNFYRLLKGGADSEENLMQVFKYVKMDKLLHPDVSDMAILTYINKDPKPEMTEEIFLDKPYVLEKKIEQRIKEDTEMMIEYWLNDKIPPCTCASWMTPTFNSFYCVCQMTTAKVQKLLNELAKEKKVEVATDQIFIDGKEVKF
jgi:hypothetical protein